MPESDGKRTRLNDLKRMLRARERASTAYRESIPMIREEIERLEADLADPPS